MVSAATDVLIVEDDFRGHRLSYVRIIAEAAMHRGYRVTLALPTDVLTTEEGRVFILDIVKRVDIVDLDSFDIGHLKELSESLGASVVVVPDADNLLLPLALGGWPGRATLSVLAMRVTGQSGSRLRQLGQTLVKRLAVSAVGLLPRVRVHYLRSSLSKPTRMGVLDPVHLNDTESSRQEAAALLSPHSDRIWYGVIGAVTVRKNLPLIVRALTELDPSGVALVVAGRIDPAVLLESEPYLKTLRDNGVPVVIEQSVLTEALFDALIATVDVVVIAHSNEGPSGVLSKAVAAGTCVVAAGARSLRRDVNAAVGTWVPLELGPLADALRSAPNLFPSHATPRVATIDDFARRLLG